MVDQAVILAGGSGVRLRPITDNIPKPLAPVCGVPFLDYLLKTIIDVGIRRILILTGYKHELIESRYGRGLRNGTIIDYSTGTAEDQTGRRLLNAYSKLDSHFLLMYGDNYWPIELSEMTTQYARQQKPVLTTVFGNRDGTGEYGTQNNVEVDAGNHVRAYDNTRRRPGLNGVDIGYFIINKAVLDPTMPGNVSFESDIFTHLVDAGNVIGHVTHEQYYYITSLESLAAFERHVMTSRLGHVAL